MTTPLLTSQGSHYEQKFQITSPERYCIDVVCLAVEPLESADGLNVGSQYENIPCDMVVTISDGEKVIFKQRAGFLSNGVLSYGRVRYGLLSVDIEKAGQYSLNIDTQKDLSFLDDAAPKLEIHMSDGAIESRLVVRVIMFCLCVGMTFLAVILIFGDLFHTWSKKRKAIRLQPL
jgi:hypothetical protein